MSKNKKNKSIDIYKSSRVDVLYVSATSERMESMDDISLLYNGNWNGYNYEVFQDQYGKIIVCYQISDAATF